MKQIIYNAAPAILKNILVTIYNLRLKAWHGKKYHNSLKEYKYMFFEASIQEIKNAQEKRFLELISFTKKNNEYYKELLHNIEIKSIKDLIKIPILQRINLRDSKIISHTTNDKLVINYTGGTSGISLKNFYTVSDVQERQANLDFFRGMFGYKFGSKTAWFSGKQLVCEKDASKKIFWVKDYFNHITYYSTFHIKKDYIDFMVQDMNLVKPQFFVGFPSAIYAIAYRIKQKKLKMDFQLKAIFPTSEPLLEYQKNLLIEVFDCPVPDQYASSEGAPFIYECPHGSLHYDMHSGIFEKRFPDSNSNEVLVTAFPTHSMPLIRYAVGDGVEFYDKPVKCMCESNMPVVKKIEGRKMTFVFSKERGVVGVTNIANVVKYMPSIERFQVIQNDKENILLRVVTSSGDQENIASILKNEMRQRLGSSINIKVEFVDEIANEKNGKFLMIKNGLSLDECIANEA